jgi:hypothetical protein
VSFLPAYRAGSAGILGGIDAAATSWAAAVVVNGGTVSAGRLALVSSLITGMKAAGSWTPMDDAWLLVAESSVQALTSLKQRRLATVTNAPTFTADRGYAFDGTTNYIDTGFIPNTHAVSMTITNVRPAAYDRTDQAANGFMMGVVQSAGRGIAVGPRQAGTTAITNSNYTGGTFTLTPVNSLGMTAGSRNGTDATTVVCYKNGVALTRLADPAAYGASLPTLSLFIGGTNSGGALANGRAATCGMVAIGASLTPTQEAADYAAWQAYMTAVGANV